MKAGHSDAASTVQADMELHYHYYHQNFQQQQYSDSRSGNWGL
jgi:hypothetical protein